MIDTSTCRSIKARALLEAVQTVCAVFAGFRLPTCKPVNTSLICHYMKAMQQQQQQQHIHCLEAGEWLLPVWALIRSLVGFHRTMSACRLVGWLVGWICVCVCVQLCNLLVALLLETARLLDSNSCLLFACRFVCSFVCLLFDGSVARSIADLLVPPPWVLQNLLLNWNDECDPACERCQGHGRDVGHRFIYANIDRSVRVRALFGQLLVWSEVN